jgi:hypothetical protein
MIERVEGKKHLRQHERYWCVEIKVTQVVDEVLALAAVEKGPSSSKVQVLTKLRLLRAKDRQVFAYRIGRYLIAAPSS